MLRIYDTKSRSKRELKEIESGHIKMYVCGPTVYNLIHIGNARTFINFDTIRRYLIWRGYRVTFVQNITDVDDKIIAASKKENCSAEELSKHYTRAFIEDMEKINVMPPTVRPFATKEMSSIISFIKTLIERGHAYPTQDGDVYFKVRSVSSYGSLSGRDVDEMQAGHRELRVDDLQDRKKDILDFALWKAAKPEEPAWGSPWGKGRPGWHIECSAMSKKYLGDSFDIHGGGVDLLFPHHENEQAQSLSLGEGDFAHYWMHSGMLQINGEKMSKSAGNFFMLRDVLNSYSSDVIRFLMLQTHYRSPLDFSKKRLDEASVALNRIVNSLSTIRWAIKHCGSDYDVIHPGELNKIITDLEDEFIESMDDDFNCPKALGVIFEAINSFNALCENEILSSNDAQLVENLLFSICSKMEMFGIHIASLLDGAEKQELPEKIIDIAHEMFAYDGQSIDEAASMLLEKRNEARAEKDWECADKIRDSLQNIGVVIKDTPQGTRIEVIDS